MINDKLKKRIFMFPGQGSQTVGMGRAIASNFKAARDVFAEVDEALGQNLSRMIFDGPDTDLNQTENTQPALMTVSIAVLRTLEQEAGQKLPQMASSVIGHSLGEYAALCAAGVFPLSDAAKLLRARGLAMKDALPPGQGAMAALLGVDMQKALAIVSKAAENQICVVANDNSSGQIVISGHSDAIERACLISMEMGAKKCVRLNVSSAFHSPLMQKAADKMQHVLSGISFKKPSVPVVCNVTAYFETDPSKIKDLLVRQITGSVRFRESILKITENGGKVFTELGSGKVLTGLVKRIAPADTILENVLEPTDVETFLTALKKGEN